MKDIDPEQAHHSPFRRFRHRRADEAARAEVRETRLAAGDFIVPVFLVARNNRREAVSTMPGVYRMSADVLLSELKPLVEKGLTAALLFGVPDQKGIAQTWEPNGIVQRTIPALKDAFPSLEIITDVCVCSYTDDGHCHIGGNDHTCEILARIAVSHAQAGADVVAPSAMMDGQVYYIRRALDKEGFRNVKIMSYAAKFASNYYGPFREAADCMPKSGDRRSYQMDPANGNEALEEIAADIEQGADSIIIKPALAYLDIVARARQRFSCPIVAYNVSGEYRMLHDAVAGGYARPEIIEETLVSLKRAGAHRIISYFTPAMLETLSAGLEKPQ